MDPGTTLAVVSLTLQVAQGLLAYYDLWQGCDQDIQELERSLLWLANTFAQLELTLEKPHLKAETVSVIRISVNGCRDYITKLCEILNKVKGVGSPSGLRMKLKAVNRRSLYIFHNKEIKALQKILDSLKGELGFAIDLLHMDTSATTLDDMRKLNQSFNSLRMKLDEGEEERVVNAQERSAAELRSDILAWLSPGLARTPYQDQYTIIEKRDPDTGRWFLDGNEFRSWQNTLGPYFWLHGDVGCGKTILCSSLIEELKKVQRGKSQKNSILYFYFAFNDAQKQELSVLLRSLLEQLCPQDGMLPSLEDLYERCEPDPPSTADLLETFLQTLRFVTRTQTGFGSTEEIEPDSHYDSLRSGDHTYILLDGLDEVQYGPKRNAVLKLVRLMSGLGLPRLHILVSSRREVDIENALTCIDRWQPLRITPQDVKKDLNIYVMNQISDSQKLRSQSDLVKDEIKHKLVDGANGMFRWTALQMQELNKKRVLRPRAIMDVLTTLPKDIHETYDRILSNIDDSLVYEALSALKWLSCSARPMFVEELAEACIIRPDEEPSLQIDLRLSPSDILEILPGLVSVDPPFDMTKPIDPRKHTFSLAHFSVKEYIFGQGGLIVANQSFEISSDLAQAHITRCCLSYIAFYDHNHSAKQKHFSVARLRTDLVEFPLTLYSHSRWAIHAAASETEFSEHVMLQAIQLLQKRTVSSRWLELTQMANNMTNEKNKPHVPVSWRDSSRWELVSDWPLYHLLAYSVTTGNQTMVRLLLNMDLDIKRSDLCGNPLSLAARYGQSVIAGNLLEKGADLAGSLLAALQSHHEDIARLLLEAGAITGPAELLEAAKYCSPSLMHDLIKAASSMKLVDVMKAVSVALVAGESTSKNMLLDAVISGQLGHNSSPETVVSVGEGKIWYDILSSGSTLNSRSLMRFLLGEVPLCIIPRLDTKDLYLRSIILEYPQATEAFESYPWFKIPAAARQLAGQWKLSLANSLITTAIKEIYDICIANGIRLPRNLSKPDIGATSHLLRQWRPDIWKYSMLRMRIPDAQELESTQTPVSQSFPKQRVVGQDYRDLARRFILEISKASGLALGKIQSSHNRPLDEQKHVYQQIQHLSGTEQLILDRVTTYFVVNGPHSIAIKDFLATEIYRQSSLSIMLDVSPSPQRPMILKKLLWRETNNTTTRDSTRQDGFVANEIENVTVEGNKQHHNKR